MLSGCARLRCSAACEEQTVERNVGYDLGKPLTDSLSELCSEFSFAFSFGGCGVAEGLPCPAALGAFKRTVTAPRIPRSNEAENIRFMDLKFPATIMLPMVLTTGANPNTRGMTKIGFPPNVKAKMIPKAPIAPQTPARIAPIIPLVVYPLESCIAVDSSKTTGSITAITKYAIPTQQKGRSRDPPILD